ncbi:hypothetical protein [Verrucosispora sp. ts21]|uniref:hypothetical protein n=1 Tax=Verrucosispora sp. ts21 TaxID=2069341 RepID=UPI0011AECF09|nr:hypothetical protein [Verrucosispora sp. ts21]
MLSDGPARPFVNANTASQRGSHPHMTAAPDSTPHGAAPSNPPVHSPRQHHDDAVLVGSDVPIAIWRLDDRDDTEPALPTDDRLASRVSQRLILVYTRPGDAVVDLDSDPHLKHATALTHRTYLPITDISMIADPGTLYTPVSLIVLRWPPRHTAQTPDTITDLLTACRSIMTADTCAIMTISSAATCASDTTYANHLDGLLPAARAAGLNHVGHIVAVTAPGDSDEFLYYATCAEAEAARQSCSDSDTDPGSIVDLLIFINESRND